MWDCVKQLHIPLYRPVDMTSLPRHRYDMQSVLYIVLIRPGRTERHQFYVFMKLVLGKLNLKTWYWKERRWGWR